MKTIYKCENCREGYDSKHEAFMNIYHCNKCGKEICIHCSLDDLKTGEVFCKDCAGEPLDKVIEKSFKELLELTNDNNIYDKLNFLKEKVNLLLK
jgi:DNA-directed RNA polymerase subunit RPC12/RpoP